MTTGPGPTPDAEVVLHQERLRVDLQRTETGRVVLRRRIVTETRQVEVTVRREELVVQHRTADGLVPSRDEARQVGDTSRQPPLTIVLSEEVPDVQLHVRPYERVTVSVHTVAEQQDVTATLSHELAEVTERPATT